MVFPAMRPAYEKHVPFSVEEAVKRIKLHIEESEHGCHGTVRRRHIQLMINEDDRHIWSPYLELEVESQANGALITGRFGPHPYIWTLFLALYAIDAMAAIAAITYALVQLTLGESPTSFGFLPIILICGVAIYGASLVGQRISLRQMHLLESFLESLLKG